MQALKRKTHYGSAHIIIQVLEPKAEGATC